MKKKLLLSMILSCIFWTSHGQWTYTELSGPKAYMGATTLGRKAYFAGGTNGNVMFSKVEIYDDLTGEWKPPKNLSVARDCPFAVTCGSKIFFAGGADFYGSGAVYSTVDIFDTLTQQWTVEQLSVPRLQAACVSYGNKVLFAGGVNLQQGIAYDIVDIYDASTGMWTIANLSEPRSTWWALAGDLAIFAGGFDLQSVSKRVDIYNFTTGTWSIDSLSVARCFVGMTTLGNKVLIAGGMTSANVPSDVVDIYDVSTGMWTTASLSFPRAFCDNQNAVTACGKAYFVGGGKLNLNTISWQAAYNIIDCYDEATNTWSVDYMPQSLVHHAVVSLGDKFLIAGGISLNPLLYQSAVEIYTCPSSSCLPEGISFTTQEQIDNFQTDHPSCTQIMGDVTISGSDINNLNGLSVITSIDGFLHINNNDNLNGLQGFNALISITGDLNIIGNSVLTSLAGLEGLTTIGGHLQIYTNPTLTSLTGLEGLTAINGALIIGGSNGGNPVLTDLTGLNSLTSVGGNLFVWGNSTLASLAGLENMINIGGKLIIGNSFLSTGNPALNSLSGLENVTSIGGDLYIGWNNSLTSLTGLDNIEHGSITNLNICNNSALSSCAVVSVCEYLGDTIGTVNIHDNAPGCNSAEEVETLCLYGIEDGEVSSQQSTVSTFPNPFTGLTTIVYELEHDGNVNLSVYNHLGQQVTVLVDEKQVAGRHQVRWDAGALPAGIYFYQLRAKGAGQVGAGKLVKY